MANVVVKNNDFQISILLLAGFVSLYLTTASLDGPWWGDSGVMLVTSQRIVDYGFGSAPDGHLAAKFPKFGLGQPLVDLPAAWAWQQWDVAPPGRRGCYFLLASSVSALIGAMMNMLVFVILRQLGYCRRTGIIAAMICGLSTMVWVYTQSLLSDSTIGLCWMMSLAMLLAYKQRGIRGWLVGAGVVMMFAVLCKVTAILALIPFVFYAIHLMRLRQDRSIWYEMSWLGMSMTSVLAIILWFNHLRYGELFNFGYQTGRDQQLGFATPLLVGLYGLLFSSGKGFFFYNPAAILSLIGWKRFRHRHRPEALLILAVAVLMLCVYASWWSWSGDWAWGPRFLVGLVPLLMLLLAPVFEEMQRRSVKAAAIISVVFLGLVIQIGGLLVEPGQYIKLVTEEYNVLQYAGYNQEQWPIRDDSLQLHFIPEFSPLAGHWWMYRCILNRDDPQRLAVLLRSPPWGSLNKKWLVDQPNLSLLRQHIWWLNGSEPGKFALVILILIAAASFAAAGIISHRVSPARSPAMSRDRYP